MADELPTEFDVVVIGTGLVESIVAAACSRIGKTVLHCDSNDYYGDIWASFSLEGLQSYLHRQQESTEADNPKQDENIEEENHHIAFNLDEGVYAVDLKYNSRIRHVKQVWGIDDEENTNAERDASGVNVVIENMEAIEIGSDNTSRKSSGDGKKQEAKEKWFKEKLLKLSRKFNIDLAPKLLYSCGEMVELLISSNVRYAEFHNVSRMLTLIDCEIMEVPCSRSDIFSSKTVSVIDKRMLMKFLTGIMDETDATIESNEKYNNQTFYNFLKDHNLNETIIAFVLYTMTRGDHETSYKNGMRRLKLFLKSLGRYGNSPFLWTIYGTGEIPQCFCRLCAVFGGIYCLHRPIRSLIIEKDTSQCQSVVIGTQKINAKFVVLSSQYAPDTFIPGVESCERISRGILINSRSIKKSDKPHVTYLRCPPSASADACDVIEVQTMSNVCPKDLCILYMSTKFQNSAEDDLQPHVHSIYSASDWFAVEKAQQTANQSKSKKQKLLQKIHTVESTSPVLWSGYYSIPNFSALDLTTNVPKNVFLCAGPTLDVDFSFSVNQAKEIFSKMFPGEQFLPRAPDPEDIILDDSEVAEEDMKSTPSTTFEKCEQVLQKIVGDEIAGVPEEVDRAEIVKEDVLEECVEVTEAQNLIDLK